MLGLRAVGAAAVLFLGWSVERSGVSALSRAGLGASDVGNGPVAPPLGRRAGQEKTAGISAGLSGSRPRREVIRIKAVLNGDEEHDLTIPGDATYDELHTVLKDEFEGEMKSEGAAVASLTIAVKATDRTSSEFHAASGSSAATIASDADWSAAVKYAESNSAPLQLKLTVRNSHVPMKESTSVQSQVPPPPPPPTNPKAMLTEDDCGKTSVPRLCCGPNATRSASWCVCSAGYGCVDSNPRGCSDNIACPRMVSFHINNAFAQCIDGQELGPESKGQAPHVTGSAPPVPRKRSECNPHSVRFIHIDKSGGTSVKNWLAQYFPEPEFKNRILYPAKMGHMFTFGGGCPEDCYAFFVRDPARRWISRFLMRERMAKTKQFANAGWVKHLDRFPTPNALAEALTAENTTLQMQARAAWKSDVGPSKRLASHFLARLMRDPTEREKVFFVGTTKTLTADFKELCRMVGLPMDRFENTTLGAQEAQNTMPATQSHATELSKLGAANVAAELHADYQLLQNLHEVGLISTPCTGPDNCDL